MFNNWKLEEQEVTYKTKTKVEENALVKNSELLIKNEALMVQLSKVEDLANSLSTQLVSCRNNHVKKKGSTKAFKKEIKEWKKELGTERRLKINLEKRVHRLLSQLNKHQVSFESSNLLPYSPDLSLIATPIHSTASEISCYICAQNIRKYKPRFITEYK